MCDACRREWDRFVVADGKPAKRKRNKRAGAHARDAPHHAEPPVASPHANASSGRRRGRVPVDEEDDVPLGPAAPFEVKAVPGGNAPADADSGSADATWRAARDADAPRGRATAPRPRDTESAPAPAASGTPTAAVATVAEEDAARAEPRASEPASSEGASDGTSTVAEVETRRLVDPADALPPRVSLEAPDPYLCPACNAPFLVAVVTEDGSHARCDRCRHVVNDLLSLVPVHPVGVARFTFGQGAAGVVNVLLFVLLVTALLVTALHGR